VYESCQFRAGRGNEKGSPKMKKCDLKVPTDGNQNVGEKKGMSHLHRKTAGRYGKKKISRLPSCNKKQKEKKKKKKKRENALLVSARRRRRKTFYMNRWEKCSTDPGEDE